MASSFLTTAEAESIIHRAIPNASLTVTDISDFPEDPYYFSALTTLTVSDGRRYVLKVFPAHRAHHLTCDAASPTTEAAVLQLLREHRHSLPFETPELVLHDDTREILPTPYLLLSFLPGTPSCREAAKVKETLVPLSAIAHTHFGRPGSAAVASTCWKTTFAALLETALRDAEDLLLLLPYVPIRRAAEEWGWTLDAVTQARLTVADLSAEDVLVERDAAAAAGEEEMMTAAVVGVCDFGSAVWGDVEFARALLDDDDDGEEQNGIISEDVVWRGRRGRRGLYKLYHSVIGVLRSFYYGIDMVREMKERRTMAKILETLEKLKTVGGRDGGQRK